MFAPERVNVPAVFFVRLPVPLRMALMLPVPGVTCATGMVPPLRVPPETATLLAIVRLLRFRVPPALTVTVPEPKAPATPVVSVPPLTVTPPPKVFVAESVRLPAVSLTRLPLPPEITPELAPAETVRTAVPRLMVPPLSVATEAVAPFRLTVPAVSVVIVALPPGLTVMLPPVTDEETSEPAVTVPPEMAEVRAPTAVTEPAEMPPEVTVAPLPKRVEPAPARDASVMTPEPPVKLRLLAVVLALVTAPKVRPVPETVAVAVALRESVALEL